jgi:hypothetical protein
MSDTTHNYSKEITAQRPMLWSGESYEQKMAFNHSNISCINCVTIGNCLGEYFTSIGPCLRL